MNCLNRKIILKKIFLRFVWTYQTNFMKKFLGEKTESDPKEFEKVIKDL